MAFALVSSLRLRKFHIDAVPLLSLKFVVMFGGAWSGMYQINIRHKEFGLLNTKGLNFTLGSNVTDFSPKTGSIYGGTHLTITGTNFGSEFTDNPV